MRHPQHPQDKRRRLLGAALATGSMAAAGAARSQTTLQYEELDTPFVTTPQNVVDAMLELARVGPSDTLLDLGSGDGRIVITAAQRFGIRGTGIEIDPRLVARARENAKKAGVAERATFLEQDLFATDLTQASVITIYLLPAVNLKLRPALMRLKPGTRIVSHDWAMGDWKPDRTITVAAPAKTVGLNKTSDLFLWELR